MMSKVWLPGLWIHVASGRRVWVGLKIRRVMTGVITWHDHTCDLGMADLRGREN